LEEILCGVHYEYKVQDWPEEKQVIFDSLFDKLVD